MRSQDQERRGTSFWQLVVLSSLTKEDPELGHKEAKGHSIIIRTVICVKHLHSISNYCLLIFDYFVCSQVKV